MEELKQGLLTLLKSNTLIGGAIPPITTIHQQMDALIAFCFPYQAHDNPELLIFASPMWDTLNKYKITREVFGIEQFQHRTTLLLYGLGLDPYSFDVIKEFKPIGFPLFPESKPLFMANSYKDPKAAIDVVKNFVEPTDTNLVISLEGISIQPKFQVQSVFNPYPQFIRQSKTGLYVSPDLICSMAKSVKPHLVHKPTAGLVKKIQQGWSPVVGLNIMPMKDGISDCTIVEFPSGFPYPVAPVETVKEQEKKSANPSGFEI